MNIDKLTKEELSFVKRLSTWKRFCSIFPEKKLVLRPSLKKEFLSHYSLLLSPTQFQQFECGRQDYIMASKTSGVLFIASLMGSALLLGILTDMHYIGRKSVAIGLLISGCYMYRKHTSYYQIVSKIYDEFRSGLNEQQINEFEKSLRINKSLGLSEQEDFNLVSNSNLFKKLYHSATGVKTKF